MTAGTAVYLSSTLELAPLDTAASCARLHAVAVLKEWRLPRGLVEDAELLVSEMITNAADASSCLPERPAIALRLLVTERSLVIEAWDTSPLDLEPRDAADGDECGRGLAVVAALATRWGCERTDRRRKRVWAELGLRIAPGR